LGGGTILYNIGIKGGGSAHQRGRQEKGQERANALPWGGGSGVVTDGGWEGFYGSSSEAPEMRDPHRFREKEKGTKGHV